MKSSPLHESPGPSGERPLHSRIAQAMGRLINGDPGEPAYEPVSGEVLALSRYIAAHSNLDRTKLLKVSADGPANTHDQGEIREYLHSDRYKTSLDTRARPRTVLSLYGKNYGSYGSTEDDFMCRFGVFNLSNGSRLIQAVPYTWEGPTAPHEYRGMRSSLRELFGDSSQARELEEYARINLGTIGADGRVSPIRPFNEQAFGMDIVPVLDGVSVLGEAVDMHFQILEGRIEQV